MIRDLEFVGVWILGFLYVGSEEVRGRYGKYVSENGGVSAENGSER